MKTLKQQWIALDDIYDGLMLDILNEKDVNHAEMKEMQKELFALEVRIFEEYK